LVWMTTWNLNETKHHVLICNGGTCMKKGGEEVTVAVRDEIEKLGVDAQIHTTRTRCNGRCKDGCVAIVYPEGVWYKEMTPELGREMVREHLLDGNKLENSIIYTYEEGFKAPENSSSPKGISKEKVK
jgi:(2Fe-2S) ferredoxin